MRDEYKREDFPGGLKRRNVCEVCGMLADPATRCTNGRCSTCHAQHCTPGGATSPGHERGTVPTPFAR